MERERERERKKTNKHTHFETSASFLNTTYTTRVTNEWRENKEKKKNNKKTVHTKVMTTSSIILYTFKNDRRMHVSQTHCVVIILRHLIQKDEHTITISYKQKKKKATYRQPCCSENSIYDGSAVATRTSLHKHTDKSNNSINISHNVML
ncbi:hypothetical protein RFI_30265 [Reticulomyxa filosa]|uniref:Uncharacterized protein n=1 Tax=Reticulomyxa filosa TaxID=46433 RepID=X6M133_RETFI|nr:hypothetical protein RFI_30265 [Reticulomyxa filosa]|eukprot:ETO07127.1 hypothetical protein RFI_30265 [Reticulomyxa filosa]